MNGKYEQIEKEIIQKYFGDKKTIRIEYEGTPYLIGRPKDCEFKVGKRVAEDLTDLVIYHANFKSFSCDCKSFDIVKSQQGEPCKHLRIILDTIPDAKYLISDDVKKTLSDEYLVELFPEMREQIIGKIKKYETTKEKGAIALRDVFIDRWDEDRIISILTKNTIERTLGKYIYEYPMKTKKGVKIIRGLSVHAVQDITHWISGIALEDVALIDEDKYFTARVKVRDTVRDFSGFGFFREPKYYESGRERKHADYIAFRKALRRALDQMIPVPIKERIFQIYEQARLEKLEKGRLEEKERGREEIKEEGTGGEVEEGIEEEGTGGEVEEGTNRDRKDFTIADLI
ncbi:MAG: hypothetical protein QMD22_09990 [archaeon]|nr:hypothetical protein [archaeon]